MKKYLNLSFFAAIAAMMAFTACTNEDALEGKNYVPEPVRFSVGMDNMTVSRTTRAQQSDTAIPGTGAGASNWSIDNLWNTNDIIALYMHDADGKWYSKSFKTAKSSLATDEVALTKNVSDVTGDFYWKNTTELKIFEAYSFGTTTSISNTASNAGIDDATNTTNLGIDASTVFSAIEVPTDQSVDADANKKEFLYTYGAIKYNTSTTPGANDKTIKLNHQLARIDIVLIAPKSYFTSDATKKTSADKKVTIGRSSTDPLKKSEVSIKGNFVKPTGFTDGTNIVYAPTAEDLNITAAAIGSWTALTGSGNEGVITPRVLETEKELVAADEATYGVGTAGKFATKYSAVVIPQDFNGKKMFFIEYDGAEYAYDGSTANDDLSGGAGKKYTYTISISEQNLVVKATIADWTTDAGTTKSGTAALQ